MNDINSKTSEFGIGELGRVPETTLEAELKAQQIKAAQQQPASKYLIVSWIPNKILGLKPMEKNPTDQREEFDTLREMLAFAQSEKLTGRDACLFGPGYTAGNLAWDNDGIGVLTWRKPVHLEKPLLVCEECGETNIQTHRCPTCGETDMIRTVWHTWENHRLAL